MANWLHVSDGHLINLDNVDVCQVQDGKVIFYFASGRVGHCDLDKATDLFQPTEPEAKPTRKSTEK